MDFHLDTNVLHNLKFIRKLSELAQSRGHQLHVSALVHAERLAQLRRQHGMNFDPNVVGNFLSTHHIRVTHISLAEAERIAEVLANVAPERETWEKLKWTHYLSCVGLGTDDRPCPSRKLSSTNDWWILAHASSAVANPRVVFVTEDRGLEGAYFSHHMEVVRAEMALKLAAGGN